MRLILIRHGQTQANVDRIIDTAPPGPGLTGLGMRQADAVPAALATERIDALFSSSLLRARQTAAPLAALRGLRVGVRDGLREIEAGEVEGRGDRESIQRFVSTELAWLRGDLDRRMPGGQTGAETLSRFDAVVDEARSAGHESVVVVSHGSMIRTWAGCRAGNVDADFVHGNPLNNTGIVVLDGGGSTGWTVLTWLDHAIGGAGLDDPGRAGPVAEERSETE